MRGRTLGVTDELRQRRKLSFSIVAILFGLAWAGIMLTIGYFVVDTPNRPLGMFIGWMAMFASGWYLAYRTGGLPRKRRTISTNRNPDDTRPPATLHA